MSFRIYTPNTLIYNNNLSPFPTPSFDSEVLTNTNGNLVWTYPQYYLKGSDMFPQNTVDLSSIILSNASTATLKYFGGVLAPNGNIYCTLGSSTDASNVLIINPYTNTVDRTSIRGITFSNYPQIGNVSATDLWSGSVAYKNNVYMIPQAAKAILNINTVNNTFNFIEISSNIADVSYNWYGCVLGQNSNIYGVPHGNTKVLRFDPSSNIVSSIDISGTPGGAYRYAGGALAPNGNIYCAPHDASNILVINTLTNTSRCDISGLTGVGTTAGKWVGAVLAPNGKIYCVPFASSNVLVIDTSNNITSTIATGVAGTNRWAGGVLATNGKIYCIPHRATQILVIDPVTDTVSTIAGVNSNNDYYAGGVLAPNNKIYMIPARSPNIGIVKTGIPSSTPWMMAPEFNKY